MRWQRSIQRLLDRWSDQIDPFGHELRDIGPLVVPTISVGSDRVDLERPVWIGGRSVGNPGAGFFSSCGLRAAGARPLELLGVWVTATAAMELSVFTNDRVPTFNSNGEVAAGDPGVNLSPQAGAASSSGVVISASGTDARLTALPARVQLPVGGLLDLSPLVLLAVVPTGRTLLVQCGTAAVAADSLKVVWSWRELAG